MSSAEQERLDATENIQSADTAKMQAIKSASTLMCRASTLPAVGTTVSYTHLDVYKRQLRDSEFKRIISGHQELS